MASINPSPDNGSMGFALFDFLPFELRYAIWRETLPRRLLLFNGETAESPLDCCTVPSSCIIPEIAQVCSEARQIVYRHGACVYDLNGSPCFLDTSTDFILINDWPEEDDSHKLAHELDSPAKSLFSLAFQCPRALILGERMVRHRFAPRCFARLSNIFDGVMISVLSFIVPAPRHEAHNIISTLSALADLVPSDDKTCHRQEADEQLWTERFEDQWLYTCISRGHPVDGFGRPDTTAYSDGWNREHPWVQEKLTCLPRFREQVVCLHLCPSISKLALK